MPYYSAVPESGADVRAFAVISLSSTEFGGLPRIVDLLRAREDIHELLCAPYIRGSIDGSGVEVYELPGMTDLLGSCKDGLKKFEMIKLAGYKYSIFVYYRAGCEY